MGSLLIAENEKCRIVNSKVYNTIFNKETGEFVRWGEKKEDNPISAPMPEIADIEISSGKCHNNCPFCYKSNTKDGQLHNMTFDEFKNIFHKLAKTVVAVRFKSGKNPIKAEINASWSDCNSKQDIIDHVKKVYSEPEDIKSIQVYNEGLLSQIAFGITSPYDNSDFFKMMQYAREFDVIPNYTCNGTDMTEDVADQSLMCGAIALSVNDIEKTYNATKMLTDKGFKQVNWHVVAHNGSFDKIMQLIKDINKDKRLKGLNALVLLKYKPKGTNAGKFKPLTQEQYNQIFDFAEKKKVRLGFDSCSCYSYLNTIRDRENYQKLSEYAEPCESTLFSIYINSHCEVSPCSFCENETRDNGEDWKQGINVLEINDFEKEVWKNPRIQHFRELLLNNERKCPMFNLEREV